MAQANADNDLIIIKSPHKAAWTTNAKADADDLNSDDGWRTTAYDKSVGSSGPASRSFIFLAILEYKADAAGGDAPSTHPQSFVKRNN
ncbi:hypothetical protein MCOR25_010396 [Pyricularia grisea]|uniref:Uncharacterized protein n=1 Tax=Pyricularia grisea TaxID=148305 RepID=A0A6P8B6M0_PYRGI|nr:hypothetical protein PgNI_05394 [Pyricularia grisea]KAI6350779.1 hypothetical protein MCOR25_010396 [Pyricularia grisea]TLD10966.1 hypothetical protein PgNI_05394 [Pyricularia grisea]